MTISLGVLLFLFGTSLLFYVQFQLLLPDLHTGFCRRQVRWSGIPIYLIISHNLLWSTQSKGFSVVNEAEVDVFLKFSSFFYDPTDLGHLISGSSAFYKSNLCIWKFPVHILLNTSLKDFEHYFASVWNDCNYVVVWTFCGIDWSIYS